MAVLKFEPNIPVTLAFTYAQGKESPSQYNNPDGTPKVQWFRKTKAGDSVYLSPYVEQELIGMDYRAGEEVTICMRVQGLGKSQKVRWEVYRPDHIDRAAEQARSNAQPPAARAANVAPPPRSTPPQNGASQGTASTVMQNCLKTAVDMAVWTVKYAKSQDLLLTPEFAAIKEIANTLFIQHSKAGNIRQMHDNQEHLAHVTRADFTTRNSDADFAQQGSQAAADAVAQRKIADARRQFTDDLNDGSTPPIYSVEEGGPPPAWLEGEDLSFLGEAPVA